MRLRPQRDVDFRHGGQAGQVERRPLRRPEELER
jgi:hypothetical protein